jgi:hypothetical protein
VTGAPILFVRSSAHSRDLTSGRTGRRDMGNVFRRMIVKLNYAGPTGPFRWCRRWREALAAARAANANLSAIDYAAGPTGPDNTARASY